MLGYFIIGITLLIALIIGGNALATANPATIVRAVRVAALIILTITAGFFAFTGRLQIASGLVFGALFFLRNKPLFANRQASDGQQSDVKTDWLHATLDHDSGEMNALILKGEFEGKRLSDLALAELRHLHHELSRDTQSTSILETYIQRNFSDKDADDTTDNSSRSSEAYSGAMSSAEAYEILELKPGASQSDIKSAHRRLMKKFHPDHDGSAYMAAKLNQAKDILTHL